MTIPQNQRARLDARIARNMRRSRVRPIKNTLYDSYIKAFRWASDRLSADGGVIAFVSNGAWIDGNAMEGFRKCLQSEFDKIYVFNLRGTSAQAGNFPGGRQQDIRRSGSPTLSSPSRCS